jgi:hypothetical protein
MGAVTKKQSDGTEAPDDNLETEEVVEEEVESVDETETETEETDSEEDDDSLPDDPAELKKVAIRLQASLAKVTKESVKRKKKIRELIKAQGGEPSTQDTTTPVKKADGGDAELQKQLAAERKKNEQMTMKLRRSAVSDLVDDALSELKVTLASPTARKDLVSFVAEDLVEEDLDDDDIADAVKDSIKTQLKARSYLKADKKKAPDINATTRGSPVEISDKYVSEVARDFGLDSE